MRASFLIFLLTAFATDATAVSLQDPPPPPPDETDDPKEIERLTEWPKTSDKKRVELDVQRIRKARTDEMAEEARDALIEEGAGAASFLLRGLQHERDEDAIERIRDVLDEITGAPHTRLIAKEFKSSSPIVRKWALLRAARFPDEGIRKPAEAALAAATRKGDDADPDEVYAAALCATSAGSLEGLAPLFVRSKKLWKDHREEVLLALAEVRGEEATAFFTAHLSKDRTAKIAALRMLSGCGTKTCLPLMRPLLEGTDNSLVVGAINVCRAVVDGDPPLDKLPVFEAIERAKKWRSRI